MTNIKVEIRTIYKNPSSPLRATANIILDDCFVIRNVSLVETEDSTFISMPSQKGRDDSWHSVCHPITKEFREKLQETYLEAYNEA